MKVERENEYAQAEQRKIDELTPLINETIKDISNYKAELTKGAEDIVEAEMRNDEL